MNIEYKYVFSEEAAQGTDNLVFLAQATNYTSIIEKNMKTQWNDMAKLGKNGTGPKPTDEYSLVDIWTALNS